jgi:uncharacterized repeat protein (TIGR01451 family)
MKNKFQEPPNHLNQLNYLTLGVSVGLLALGLFFWCAQSVAAAGLTVTPITWNVVGLDSNNVNVGPNNFPVGVRVCNSSGGVVTNMTATFAWVTSDAYIDLRSGSQNPIVYAPALSNNACKDFYFEVSITRNANAYNHTRKYRIAVTTTEGATGMSPEPREIFVEHLISQNRNATLDVKLDGVSIAPGGSMSLMIGNSYNITLNASTATQGYEQIESFINFPNTIFRVNSVATTYSANAGTDADAATKLYANGCNWENHPLLPNYRSCLSTGKYGGTVTVVYNVTIIGGAGSSNVLSTLIYDFSGSSYHYNADFSTSARIANIVGPSTVTIAKRFVPDSIAPGGTSQLMFTLNNPTAVSIAGVVFSDTLPSGVTVAGTPAISYTGCGSGAFSPVPTGGTGTLNFQNGTIAPNSSCIIKINVTASTVTTYNNITFNLYINNTTNTGNTASASLVVANPVACTPGQSMATWYVPNATYNPPESATGGPTIKATNVNTATASVLTLANSEIKTTSGVTDTYSWSAYPFNLTTSQYFQFLVDTRHYQNVRMDLYVRNPGGGNGPDTMYIGYMNGATFTPVYTNTSMRSQTGFVAYTAYYTNVTSTSNATAFRIIGSGSANNQNGNMLIDNIVFSGCSNAPPPPTISKLFSPSTIPTNTVSTLTFTISNLQDGFEPLTNVTFNDPLPTGLEVASPPTNSTSGAGCTGVTFTPSAGATTLYYTATNMTAGASCTAQVNVKPTKAGQFDNVSGYIGATESGQNKTATGYATASLIAIAPPVISKQYATSPIYVGATTVLTYTLTNPNPSTTLTGISFTDLLTNTTGVSVSSPTTTCTSGSTSGTANQTVSLSSASLTGGASCTVTVIVTGNNAGTYTSTTSNVTSTNGGTGNTATATLEVRAQTPAITLQKKIGPTSTGPFTPFIVRDVGAEVYFQFTIENTGDTVLNNVIVKDPPGGATVCSLGSLSVYAFTTCVTGPTVVTSTDRVTNTAQASSNGTLSANSSASHWYQMPTRVSLNQFGARQDDVSLLALGVSGIVMIGALALLVARRRINSK